MHTYWYLGRSAGFISYWILCGSVLLGLAVSSRIFDGWVHRAWIFEFHRFLSVIIVIFVLFHALIMLPDPYAQFRLKELLMPFQSHIHNTAMALGIVGLYGLAFLTASFYVRFLIGQRVWRMLHYLTFAVYGLALAHAILNGTDSSSRIVLLSYYASAIAVIFLVFYRMLATRRPLTQPARVRARRRLPDVEAAQGERVWDGRS